MATVREWSPQQQAIREWFRTGAGNLVVRARAGTGKTTTLLGGIECAPAGESIIMAAFNKRIAEELSDRLTHPRAEAKTLHALGFRIVRKMWPRTQIARPASQRAAWLAERVCGEQAPDRMLGLVAKLCSLGRECLPLAQAPAELADLAWRFDCVPDAAWGAMGWDLDRVLLEAYRAMQIARDRSPVGIDFADMLYLPVVQGWVTPACDTVVIDEAQDMNPAQLILATKLARRRVCACGDDRQGIYAFRGADSGALDRIKADLSAGELGLTTTYRCGQAITAMAQKIVPDYQAAPTNGPGRITRTTEDCLEGALGPGDVVLSRANAPLVKLCLSLLRGGTPARVEGKDVAAGLRKLVADLAVGPAAHEVEAFLERLTAWYAREMKRAAKGVGDVEARVAMITDKYEMVEALTDGAATVGEVSTRIDAVFEEIKGGRCVLLSSVHKAKGLEWPRVHLLEKTFARAILPGPGEVPEPGTLEELNIRYVAITRAIEDLVLVEDDAPVLIEDEGAACAR